VSPYGRSKWMVEQVLQDQIIADKSFKFAALRYFNASGCAMDGSLGEDHDPETHLIPVVLQTILGLRPEITVFGTDYPTPDGTNIRDYIHVDDLADAHVKALDHLRGGGASTALNVGTGRGTSVMEVIEATERLTGHQVPWEAAPRRTGDPVTVYADPHRAASLLDWHPVHDLDDIVASAWQWHSTHLDGYASPSS